MHQLKLLIVDDDLEWLQFAEKYFTSHKYKVFTAGSCSDGLSVFNSKKPDCVLLDYNLRDSDAEVFCKQVRNTEKLIRTPIVVISGEDAREMPAYTACQADGFILKCSSWEKTRAVIEMVMRRVWWERGVVEVDDLRLEKTNLAVYRCSRVLTTLSPDQFRIMYLLLQESPGFVSEEMISQYLYESHFAPDNEDSIRGLMQRLRKKLGAQLGRRIKNKTRLGWVYVQPRFRKKASGVRAQ